MKSQDNDKLQASKLLLRHNKVSIKKLKSQMGNSKTHSAAKALSPEKFVDNWSKQRRYAKALTAQT